MKDRESKTVWTSKRPLYPTWFRWKEVEKALSAVLTKLYIPHGSDERLRVLMKNFLSLSLYPTWFRWKMNGFIFNWNMQSFISHMVQMKVKAKAKAKRKRKDFISHMVQMKVAGDLQKIASSPALYPTWFRWKLKMSSVYGKETIPLYPTWFRWKWSTPETANAYETSLYIPHGSDERQ